MSAGATGRDDSSRIVPPVLSAEEERALCHRWYEHHDVAAAERLIGSQLHLIAGIAMAHRDCGAVTQELIGEAYIGLMRAACRYNPTCGTRFATYAIRCVRAAIQQKIERAAPSPQTGAFRTLMPPPHARGGKRRAPIRFVSKMQAG